MQALQARLRPIRPAAQAQRLYGAVQARDTWPGRGRGVCRITVTQVMLTRSECVQSLIDEYLACETPEYPEWETLRMAEDTGVTA